MKSKSKQTHLTDRMVLIAIGLGAVYWIIETFLFFVLGYQINFFTRLFGPDLAGVCTRVIVVCLFLIFGSHAQHTFNQRQWAETELEKVQAENIKLQQEIEALKKE